MLSVQTATFSKTPHGRLCITFDDAAFARADVVFIDPGSREVSALLDGLHVRLGTVSAEMADSFMKHNSVILAAPHPRGHEVMLEAALLTLH